MRFFVFYEKQQQQIIECSMYQNPLCWLQFNMFLRQIQSHQQIVLQCYILLKKNKIYVLKNQHEFCKHSCEYKAPSVMGIWLYACFSSDLSVPVLNKVKTVIATHFRNKMCNKKMLSEHCKYFEFLHLFEKSEKQLHKFYVLKICEKDFVYLAL